jgi:Domain of unknown function (DUF4395)
MELSLAREMSDLPADGRTWRLAMVNENEARAAAGLTMVTGAVAFSYAYFAKQYVPLQIAATVFFVEFLIRVTASIRYSPFGIAARAMTLRRPPEWVSARPKRFAWTLGLAMAFAMTVITNVGIRGTLPRTICLICLTLMWMESVLGLCVGCKIHNLLVRRGWARRYGIELCADGSCEPPVRDRFADLPGSVRAAPGPRTGPRVPCVDLDPGAHARALAGTERTAGVVAGQTIDVLELRVGLDQDRSPLERHVPIPLVSPQDRERSSRIAAQVREPPAASVHVDEYPARVPQVPGGDRMRAAVISERRDHGRIGRTEELLDLFGQRWRGHRGAYISPGADRFAHPRARQAHAVVRQTRKISLPQRFGSTVPGK